MTTLVSGAAILISVIIAAYRLTGEHGEFYQGIAHLWVGSLIGYWCATYRFGHPSVVVGICAVALTIVEIAAFLTAAFHGAAEDARHGT